MFLLLSPEEICAVSLRRGTSVQYNCIAWSDDDFEAIKLVDIMNLKSSLEFWLIYSTTTENNSKEKGISDSRH